VSAGDPREIGSAISVEQTIEFPHELAPTWIQREVVGQITDVTESEVEICYNPDVVGGEFIQFLNVLWGNVSLFPGVRIIDLSLPQSWLRTLRGPRFGIRGLRERLGVPHRPLLCTALKPMGLDPTALGAAGAQLARAGFDIIKDDHGLANQPWAPWRERVEIVSEAIAAAAAEAGTHSIYLPSVNVPIDRLEAAAFEAKELGAGGLLVLPGLVGFDAMRSLAENDALALPLMAHPSFLGSHVMNPDQGISHGIVFGTLMRLAGADISIFPNYGGRFSFTQAECREISAACTAPLGGLAGIWPSPGGGMTLTRLDEIMNFYGPDVALLIGGDLHRGSLDLNAEQMVTKVESFPPTP
jgi:ribulose-bisphosphate carboxylase large chain